MVVQLLFDAIDRFDQVVLIAARKGHARDGMFYGNQRFMYCDLLLPIHAGNLNPFGESRKPRGHNLPDARIPKRTNPAF